MAEQAPDYQALIDESIAEDRMLYDGSLMGSIMGMTGSAIGVTLVLGATNLMPNDPPVLRYNATTEQYKTPEYHPLTPAEAMGVYMGITTLGAIAGARIGRRLHRFNERLKARQANP